MTGSPENIFKEYEAARRFKAAIGKHGLFEQGRINERFFVGDQWHGAQCGNERPLVRHNVIKRIGDFKISQLTGSAVSVKYSAEGFSETLDNKKDIEQELADLSDGENRNRRICKLSVEAEGKEVGLKLMSDKNKTAERRSLIKNGFADFNVGGIGRKIQGLISFGGATAVSGLVAEYRTLNKK